MTFLSVCLPELVRTLSFATAHKFKINPIRILHTLD